MAESARSTIDEQRAWYQKDLEALEVDLTAVIQKHWPNTGGQLIVNGLIEVTGKVLSAIVATDPATKTAIETKLADLCLFVSTTNQPPQ